MPTRNRPLTAAFYLPQFHPIPENDAWWGEGFTEWTNVARALPQYQGHSQPMNPSDPPGRYDLRNPQVLDWQFETARSFDVDAFIYYYYWFAGKRLLERPIDLRLKNQDPMPFALCWANENWTRRWDGKQREILIAQNYDDNTAEAVFFSMLPYLRDARYLTVNDSKLLMVHRADHLPCPRDFARRWRELAIQNGVGALYLVASETSFGLDPRQIGFDAIAEFPPVGDSGLQTVSCRRPRGLRPEFAGRINSYDRLMQKYMRRAKPPFTRHHTVVPRWDNTARRQASATVFLGSSPAKYQKWLTAARRSERELRAGSGIVFVNAWNEWAEGANLEPDLEYGYQYLEATRWNSRPIPEHPTDVVYGHWNMRGLLLALASSLKYLVQTARRRLLSGLAGTKWRRDP